MREIVLDTETTGLDPLDGHRAHLWLVHATAQAVSLSAAPARHVHQPAGLHVLGHDHDHVGGVGGVIRHRSLGATKASALRAVQEIASEARTHRP